jgi:hypothetical protein
MDTTGKTRPHLLTPIYIVSPLSSYFFFPYVIISPHKGSLREEDTNITREGGHRRANSCRLFLYNRQIARQEPSNSLLLYYFLFLSRFSSLDSVMYVRRYRREQGPIEIVSIGLHVDLPSRPIDTQTQKGFAHLYFWNFEEAESSGLQRETVEEKRVWASKKLLSFVCVFLLKMWREADIFVWFCTRVAPCISLCHHWVIHFIWLLNCLKRLNNDNQTARVSISSCSM